MVLEESIHIIIHDLYDVNRTISTNLRVLSTGGCIHYNFYSTFYNNYSIVYDIHCTINNIYSTIYIM